MFGSGKTELSLNTAILLKKDSKNVALADIDIISPYFRSRDEKEFLEETGIKMVTVPKMYMHADLPIVPAEVGGYVSNPEFLTVVDVGGNEDGSIVLGSLRNFLENVEKTVFFVVNVFRPFSTNEEEIISNMTKISGLAKVKMDYLVNNSNIGPETGVKEIEMGESIISNVSQKLEIPVAFTSVLSETDYHGKFPVLKIKRFMKNPW